MKCYYHTDREAVATCKCGRCLCRECADKHNPLSCDSCWDSQERLRQATIQSSTFPKMNVKKCYYHNDREAVKNCRCGKPLCNECAGKHPASFCDECWDERKRIQEEQELSRAAVAKDNRSRRISTKPDKESKAIIRCLLLAIVFLVAFILFRYFTVGFEEVETSHGTFSKIMNGIMANLFYGSFFFMIPFGWHVLNKYLDREYIIVFWATILLRVIVASLVGFIAFPYYMVKLIINRITA